MQQFPLSFTKMTPSNNNPPPPPENKPTKIAFWTNISQGILSEFQVFFSLLCFLMLTHLFLCKQMSLKRTVLKYK